MSESDNRPSVNLAAIKDNPWRVIQRVKRTLMEAGLGHQISGFEVSACKELVLSMPTEECSYSLRVRVLEAAKEYCRVSGA